MKNDYKIGDHKVSVLPTILVSAIGMVPDVRTCVSSDFKCPGDSVYVLGATRRELGRSLYNRLYGGLSETVPRVDFDANRKLYRTYHELIIKGLLASGHDLSEGGLAVALMESCLGGGFGATVDLSGLMECTDLSIDFLIEETLFTESAGRFLISIDPGKEQQFLSVAVDVPLVRIGAITEDPVLCIQDGKECLASLLVEEISRCYREPLYRILGMERG
jgi:phosphoribosylformylglycinamidine synthase